MINLKNKTAIVTGATRGIGLEVARKLAACGANIAIIDIELGDGASIAAIEKDYGVKCKGYAANVADADAVESTMKTIIADFETEHILVKNAGITRDGLLMRMKVEDFDSVIAVNLRSAFLCTKALVRHFMGQRTGRIINMASINGIRCQAGQANYAASKAGLIGLTKSNAVEFASRNITVNAVAPGFIEAAMTAKMDEETTDKYVASIPLRRMGQPEDIANAVAFLASDAASYITGQVLGIDGGLGA